MASEQPLHYSQSNVGFWSNVRSIANVMSTTCREKGRRPTFLVGSSFHKLQLRFPAFVGALLTQMKWMQVDHDPWEEEFRLQTGGFSPLSTSIYIIYIYSVCQTASFVFLSSAKCSVSRGHMCLFPTSTTSIDHRIVGHHLR